MTAQLEIRDVTMVFPGSERPFRALDPISLSIDAGSLIVIVGPSGCGKTTLLDLIAGFRKPTTGDIEIDGRSVTAPGRDRGVVFQQPALLPWMSVLENIGFGPRLAGASASKWREIAIPMLRLVGLEDFARHHPYELSAGMQQRVSIARALANDPGVLLMDEPFAALDALTRDRMQERLLEIWKATRKTIVFVTHSVEEAVFLGSRLIVMSPNPGRIIADVQLPFGRAFVDHGLGRSVRTVPAFVMTRERVLKEILSPRTRTSDEIDRWAVEFDPSAPPPAAQGADTNTVEVIAHGG